MAARILIADDDGISRKLLRRLLEQEGHTVRAAADGAEALALFSEEASDVVLLDVVMPELDGITVLERLKATPGAEHVPVIMISAVDETDSVVRCIEIGADDYLSKPFNPVVLRARINAGLTKKRLHELERSRVRDVFSRFLPEHVVDDVLERTDGDLRLGGVTTVGTVMFTDLRGFTAFSENRPPELVIDALNRYFDETSDAILDHGGTLVAYRGDGFLAAFGAPIEVDDHADRALADRHARWSRCGSPASTRGCARTGWARRCGWGLASTAGRSCPATSARSAGSNTPCMATPSTQRRASRA